MQHRKQAYEHIERTVNWNNIRGNTPDTLDYQLEIDMLQEELDEFVLAVKEGDKVAMFDALLDLDFVRIGTLSKMGILAEQQVDGYEAVIRANEQKSSTKNAAGKITKPLNFVGPEAVLAKILGEKG